MTLSTPLIVGIVVAIGLLILIVLAIRAQRTDRQVTRVEDDLPAQTLDQRTSPTAQTYIVKTRIDSLAADARRLMREEARRRYR